ncbi:conserved hypothetical protein [Neospora caninum Liverpool]|uniref:EB1 C-terminal domain-containing protein n=1 Tax=Neospora caninum (strain Liverpool) TaxID=572307 RepID=F0V7H0_NEOCL|nr:conserved hypothetical protein [Neospora caninum Liverpool]CBZ49661.1 conserved hypothetical protein [Neospora caninum Liverpool]CEL64245.1 TPA: hypothetical protein BN1204_001490 [Neospora caninum Liverpool]|eukprot:XP_003879696.1 conserved hypothetical protein [Neospora caninum Liverpool]
MEDPCNADSLFIGVFFVPNTKRLKCCFFTDGDSDDADFPAQALPGCDCQPGTGSRYNSVEWPSNDVPTEFYSRFRGRRCYCFPPGAPVTTIRDGEVADVDKITTTGITLRLDHELLKNEEWSGGSLLYMVEHAGSWVEKQFSELDGSVTLTEQRSVTFVVKSKSGQNYLHAAGGGNMRVSFPGAYVICPNGRVVECALTANAHTPTHQQHEALVTQLIRQLRSKALLFAKILTGDETRKTQGNAAHTSATLGDKEIVGEAVHELECLLDLDEQCQQAAKHLKLEQLILMRERNAYLEKLGEIERFCEAKDWKDNQHEEQELLDLLKEILYSEDAEPV